MTIRDFKKIYEKSTAELQFIAAWNFYFLFKLYLFVKGSIRLDIFLNLLFLIFVLLPAPAILSRYRVFRYGRNVLNIATALLLLWHDSWLPPLLDAGSFLSQQGMPSFEYAISFMGGYYRCVLQLCSDI